MEKQIYHCAMSFDFYDLSIHFILFLYLKC